MSKEGKGAAAQRKRQNVVPDAALLTKYQRSLAQHRQRKRARGDADDETRARFRAFQERLKAEKSRVGPAADEEAGAANGTADGVAADGDRGSKAEAQAYDGQVNKGIDHRAYLPAAWRVRCNTTRMLRMTAAAPADATYITPAACAILERHLRSCVTRVCVFCSGSGEVVVCCICSGRALFIVSLPAGRG